MRLRFKEVKGITIEDVQALFAEITNAKVTAIRFDDDSIEVVLNEDEKLSEPDFWEDTSCECKMCGKERSLNDDGYCSQCWVIWS